MLNRSNMHLYGARVFAFRSPEHLPIGTEELWQTLWREVDGLSGTRGHLSTRSAFALRDAWREQQATTIGYPASLLATRDPQTRFASLELATWPNDDSEVLGLVGHFELLENVPIRFTTLYVNVFPENSVISSRKRFQVPQETASRSELRWEHSLAKAFAALATGVDAVDIDNHYFNRSDAWRRYYEPNGGRIVRTSDGAYPSMNDRFWSGVLDV